MLRSLYCVHLKGIRHQKKTGQSKDNSRSPDELQALAAKDDLPADEVASAWEQLVRQLPD